MGEKGIICFPFMVLMCANRIPAYWYYVMAAGGAVLVLVSVALALVLHYHRFRYAAKKTDHSITYKTSHYTNGAPLAVEPTLTIKLEQDRGSHC